MLMCAVGEDVQVFSSLLVFLKRQTVTLKWISEFSLQEKSSQLPYIGGQFKSY